LGFFYLDNCGRAACMVSPEEHKAFLSIAEAEAHRHGAEVIEMVVRGDPTRRVIELFVDSEAGVSLGLCQEISKSLIQEIDKTAFAVGNYRLDVSSPGIDRPLKFPWQYRKHAGRKLQVAWSAEGGPQTSTGKLVSINDEELVMQPDNETVERHIRFEAIVEARVKTPW